MSTHWIMSLKASLIAEWLVLPPKEVPHILDTIQLLTETGSLSSDTLANSSVQSTFINQFSISTPHDHKD